MKKTLVIGGNGFIGKNIVEMFRKYNQHASIYDITEGTLGVENYQGDILNDENFDEIISKYDEIIYLITKVSPKKSMDEPESAYVNDVPLLIKTLDSCLKSGIKRVIFSSSGGTVYGDLKGSKAKETDFNEPINHYAICKLTCEKILELYNKLYGMENISLRISNPYGKGQNPNSGVGAITAFASQIRDDKEITLYGDGSITRDFINVEDVAIAFLLAGEWKFDKNVLPIFNIGSGVGLTLKEIIDIISEAFDKEPKINFLPERKFDVKYNVLDVSRSEEYLGFKPSSDHKEKIKQYVYEYYK